MIKTDATGQNGNSVTAIAPVVQCIRFVPEAQADQKMLLEFTQPTRCQAVCVGTEEATAARVQETANGIDILTVNGQPSEQLGGRDELLQWVAETASPEAGPPVVITLHGAQIVWGRGRAAIVTTAERMETFLLALVDFCYHDCELQALEREVAASWPHVENDTPLAHAVTRPDRRRFEDVGQRLEQALGWRMRRARLEPLFFQLRSRLPPMANQVIERLRERTQVEERLEAFDGQLDVIVHVYELGSQKIGDFKTARMERTLEMIIIVLLAAETFLLLLELLHRLEGG